MSTSQALVSKTLRCSEFARVLSLADDLIEGGKALIKTEAPIMQEMFRDEEVPVPAARREALAHKGRALYGKYCGTGGRGICAESFAEYHLWRGEYAVVRDLLEFLVEQAEILRQTQPLDAEEQELLAMTERLIGRVQALVQPEAV